MRVKHLTKILFFSSVLFSLSACETEPNKNDIPTVSQPLSSASNHFELDDPVLEGEANALLAAPSFHIAPVLLPEPSDVDRDGLARSAYQSPSQQFVQTQMQALSTQRLTPDQLQKAANQTAQKYALDDHQQKFRLAAGSSVSTYTPAQIRAAYGLPAITTGSPTPIQSAQMGAGQTIYIIAAMHNPNAAAELAAFNQKFGLPSCVNQTIAANMPLPLAPANLARCEFSVVFNTPEGNITTSAPRYDSGWATEISLDVQWAHAIAPLARIVLIEAQDASLNSLLGAIKLANKMGSGIVSMSFGTKESSFMQSVDSVFSPSNMTYLAATGDWGADVFWPSASSKVLAVGGTSLNYSGSGNRQEVAWSGTGGGTSRYIATPSYQTPKVPGLGVRGRRALADVALNADPATGQYVAVMAPGSSSVQWISAGGTSLSTPQWAGLIAMANATRLQNKKAVLGQIHAVIYNDIASNPSSYRNAFMDIVNGNHGSCASCNAQAGYDQLTGLGTPNVSALLSALQGGELAPVLTASTIKGQTGSPFTFTVNYSASNPVTFSLQNAPNGMSINTNGIVSWNAPVVGNFAVTIHVQDTVNKLKSSAIYNISITAPAAPTVQAESVNGKAGVKLEYITKVTASNPVILSLQGAPSGMSLQKTNVMSWDNPVQGQYSVTLQAKDSKTNLVGSAKIVFSIAAASAPVISNETLTHSSGQAFSLSLKTNHPNALIFSLQGAPAGMAVNNAGLVSWAQPLVGSYRVTVIGKDLKTGLSGQALINLSVTAQSVTITYSNMNGKVGKMLNGSIHINTKLGGRYLISISGVPLGMGFYVSGLNLNAIWQRPVKGTYTLAVKVTDQTGKITQANIPVVIAP